MTYRVEWPAVQLLLRRLAAEGDLANQIQRAPTTPADEWGVGALAAIAQQAARNSRKLDAFAEQLTAFARSPAGAGPQRRGLCTAHGARRFGAQPAGLEPD